MKTYKLSNHIILSGITVSMLFSPLMALPSGGKFTHGTSGSISTSGNNMNITGKGTNSVIQWGGGFNIGKNEQVNFNGSNKNYLNIAHGTSKSTIEGILNASGNNVFLINPNGVIITKTGTINANRFVASTSSMSDGDMKAFANLKSFDEGLTFSPVFKTQKAGNVVNMGNINTNDVLLIGNKVDIQGGRLGNEKSKTHLVGNKVFVDFGKSIIQSDYNFISALDKSHVYISSVDYYNNVNKYNKANFVKGNYLTNAKNIEKFVSIGSDIDWWHFAKGWNENEQFRNTANEYRLINSIDFGGNQGKNYANYCIDGLGCTSMIVGNGYDWSYLKSFDKSFDGQGYTLKNINIDTTVLSSDKNMNVGLFGSSKGAVFKNINIDYMNGSIKSNGEYVGGFVGKIDYIGNITNISLSNISSIVNNNNTINDNSTYSSSFVGGFAGYISTIVENVKLNNIGKIIGNGNNKNIEIYVGGFAGLSDQSIIKNVILSNINEISGSSDNKNGGVNVGGFLGRQDNGSISNVTINHINNISGNGHDNFAYVGGFAGVVEFANASNIVLNHIDSISSSGDSVHTMYGSSYAGGFAGAVVYGDIKNIIINDIKNIYASSVINYKVFSGGFAGGILDPWGSYYPKSNIENIYMFFHPKAKINNNGKFIADIFSFAISGVHTFNNIHVYHKTGELANNIDKGFWQGNRVIHTYTNTNSGYADFENKVSAELDKDGLHKDKDGNLVFTKDFDINSPSKPTTDPDVVLESDDVISANDLNKWLDEIYNGTYWVDIKDLKLQGVSEEIQQSIAFLEALYGQSGMQDILEKISTDYKKASDKFNTFNKNKTELLLFINTQLKDLVNATNDKLNILLTKQKELDTLIKAYNNYVALINKGLANESDPEFITLKNQINTLMSESDVLASEIGLNQNTLKLWQDKANKDSNGHFKIIGAFANVILNTNPKLDQITEEGGGGEDPNKPELPDNGLEFEQTASFNLIGDETVEEEKEEKEVEETAMMQKNRTCIVSDNFKTMNPCAVGGL
ncbi:filamentous hemagglutinin N-terminal domain-containing protein [Campylobacter lari]|uniref:two-partner secretion domain-containing protein n=1 Tax=Campylobacter lari TaxID=201 RepID=UPI00397AB535